MANLGKVVSFYRSVGAMVMRVAGVLRDLLNQTCPYKGGRIELSIYALVRAQTY